MAAGLTHEQLAALTGTGRTSIGQWESGKVTPSGAARFALSVALKVPIETVNSWFSKTRKEAA